VAFSLPYHGQIVVAGTPWVSRGRGEGVGGEKSGGGIEWIGEYGGLFTRIRCQDFNSLLAVSLQHYSSGHSPDGESH
jgi:hypothetical protein